MSIRVCFEREYVKTVLAKCKSKDLAVIDTDDIDIGLIKSAVSRGVFVYGYINVGALESGRTCFDKLKHLRLAKYEGWSGEYWIDPTAQEWKDHIVGLSKKVKATGAIGVYLDNTDIYGMIYDGEIKKQFSRALPTASAVYKALTEMTKTIHNAGLIVMPNGGDAFVRKFFTSESNPIRYIPTINQEGVLYEDFEKQPSSERKYRTAYVDWAKKKGCYIRGIEYCKKAAQIAECKAYYALHGWQGLYISKHTDLRGD